MTELLSAAQMRAVEAAEIASGRVSGEVLMERAGGGVVDAMLHRWPDLAGGTPRAVVLAGPGNNGGDGFVIARLLKARGWQVTVYLFGDAERLPPDARLNCTRWQAEGPLEPLTGFSAAALAAAEGQGRPVVIDALFGTGLSRPVAGALAELLQPLTDMPEPPRIVAVDIPSGICSDSGRVLGRAIAADLTVSFHVAKLGHYLDAGPDYAGQLVIAPIGLPTAPGGGADRVDLVGTGAAGRVELAACDKGRRQGWAKGQHKFAHGHALVMSGGAGRTGAARLAARAALRTGAGLVTLGVPPAAMEEVAAQITALMMTEIPDGAALTRVLEDRRLNALCLGPGLGVKPRARALVEAALAAGRATVLDADALTLFRTAPEELFEQLHSACVLTPHDGEFARIFPDLAQRLREPAQRGPAFSRLDAARAAARRAGCVVLLKGPDTVIAAPEGRAGIHGALYSRRVPWLATAGAGDVLAGIVTGLLARGLPPFGAARAGAWLHAEAARCFGPGLIAEDLPEALPAVFRALAEAGAGG
ncbi:NAD(P)H-hydrate dehydratase [Pseudodonghicola flavimaris]|uniref:Bifunctional NAD(P)H-hydrate repair enzyme n=1 Tax=Pseudodonghicola flavimaris TaxID=3050036 RepID=A0ABT7F794_9RHOB|nr:NAD(P)H-hydrate dehydratase [Pseudodonghicola flavimaris]MDK3020473.1 NAD(P)H-hydrate dehydratase [Pseudodonghicola flavimaris]